MLSCRDITKKYKNVTVVDNLSFQVEEGEVFALLGSNGAGKTTTIKMILGLIQKDSGEIEKKEGLTIGYSPETPYFPPFLTGREALTYEQVGRRKLEHDSIRHGRFTIIANQRIIAFIKQNIWMLYIVYPFLAIQYKIR